MKEFFSYTIIELGKYQLKVLTILLMLLLIVAANVVLRLIKKSIYSTSRIDAAKQHSYYSLLKYIVLVIAFIYGFQILGFNLSLLLAGSAALLVGIGLGLQNIFSDFVSGILLLVESKIKVNDILEVNGLICRVKEINLRTTTVLAREDKYIIFPNTHLTRNQIINWTMSGIASRFEVKVGVSYSSDILLVTRLLQEIIDTQEGALKTPAPFIRFTDFGASALDFSIFFWADEIYGVENIKSRIRYKIFESFKAHHIDIPFPQRVVHINKTSEL